ncbi:MAG TPA: DUF2188 domain-containing protein [Bacillales bacterium]
MNHYTVVSNKDITSWHVKIEDVAPLETYDKKDKAIEAGERLAKQNRPSTLSILDDENHDLEEKRTYEKDD